MFKKYLKEKLDTLTVFKVGIQVVTKEGVVVREVRVGAYTFLTKGSIAIEVLLSK